LPYTATESTETLWPLRWLTWFRTLPFCAFRKTHTVVTEKNVAKI